MHQKTRATKRKQLSPPTRCTVAYQTGHLLHGLTVHRAAVQMRFICLEVGGKCERGKCALVKTTSRNWNVSCNGNLKRTAKV